MLLGSIATGVLRKFSSTAQPIAKVALPELKFNYSALEPVLSSKLLELHHKKHHQAYVNNLNAAVEQFEGKRKFIQRPEPILITIRWSPLPRPLSSILEDISIIPSIGKIWPPLVKEEVNSQMRTLPLPSKSRHNSEATKILLRK